MLHKNTKTSRLTKGHIVYPWVFQQCVGRLDYQRLQNCCQRETLTLHIVKGIGSISFLKNRLKKEIAEKNPVKITSEVIIMRYVQL
jgi:hypothetical protein